ncbi:MAG: alanyl-tRNA editing protein [Bryobacteraceae bacterium]
MPFPTTRLYLEDSHLFETEATITGVRDNALAFDRTCFHPGGGGQPSDQGLIGLPSGLIFEVASAEADASGVIWHVCPAGLSEAIFCSQTATLTVNAERRLALTRYHTVLHVLNTIALRDYKAWITGAQIGTDYSRIDFKWDGFSAAACPELEAKVNAVLDAGHTLKAFYLNENEFQRRTDLLRTLDVSPPVIDGRVRVVAIDGFDEQACGGTHVHSTADVGRFSITKTENKGKSNKRLYVRLEPPAILESKTNA